SYVARLKLAIVSECQTCNFSSVDNGDSFFFFSSRRRHTRSTRDWSSDVCSSDLFCWANTLRSGAAAASAAAAPAWITSRLFIGSSPLDGCSRIDLRTCSGGPLYVIVHPAGIKLQ